MSKTARRLIIAALFSAAGFAITIVWYKLSETADTGLKNLKPIARLVSSINDVQKKQVQKLIWQPAIDNEVLHVGEAIRTAPNAEARIEFLGSNTAIDLEPDSAIVLEENDGKLALDFLKGNIMVKADTSAGAADSGITVKSGDKNIALGKSEITLGKNQTGDLDLQVLKGSVAGLDEKTMNAGKIKILSPLPGEPIYVNPDKKEFAVFKWQPLPPGYDVFLEFGDTRTNLKPLTGAVARGEGDSKTAQLEANVKVGKSFFRLVARSRDAKLPEMFSAVMRNSVLAKIAPAPLSPEKESIVAVNKADPNVEFLWNNPAGFARVILEIATSPDLKQKVKTEYLEKATGYTFVSEKSGVYYWRVSGVLEGRKEVISSAIQKFKLNMLDALVPPELESPKMNEKVPSEAIKVKGLNLSWKAVTGANSYRVTVEKSIAGNVRTPASTEKVFQEEGKVLQVAVKDLKPGSYIWTVASISKSGEVSKPAEKRTFTVQTLPVLQWADGKLRDDYYYLTLKPSVALKWEKGDAKATAWNVRIYRSDSELNPVTQKVATTGAELALPEDGLYRAEVDALDDKGQVVARSVSREVKVAAAPLLPGPQFAEGTPDQIEASGAGQASLRWLEVQGATQYVMQVQSPDGKSKQEYNFKSVEGSLRGLMPGDYKVSLRAVDQNGRMGPPGEEKSLKVPSQSSLRAPKLKGLKVK